MKFLVGLACLAAIGSSQLMDSQVAILIENWSDKEMMRDTLIEATNQLKELAQNFAEAGKTLQVLIVESGDNYCWKTRCGLTEEYSTDEDRQSYITTLQDLAKRYSPVPVSGEVQRNSYASILYAASQFSHHDDIRRAVVFLADQCELPTAKGNVEYGKIPKCAAEVSLEAFVAEMQNLRTALLWSSVKPAEQMSGATCHDSGNAVKKAGLTDSFYDGVDKAAPNFDSINYHLSRMLEEAWVKTTTTQAPVSRVKACVTDVMGSAC